VVRCASGFRTARRTRSHGRLSSLRHLTPGWTVWETEGPLNLEQVSSLVHLRVTAALAALGKALTTSLPPGAMDYDA